MGARSCISEDFTAQLCLIHYKTPILSAWLPLCPHPHLGWFGGKSTSPCFGWLCKVAEEQAQRRSRRCLLAQKISSSGKGLAKPAQCHLLFDPPPVSEAHSGGRPCQQQEDVEWTKEKPFQMVRTASTLGPV